MPNAKRFMKKFPSVTRVNTNCLEDMACPKCGNRRSFDIDCASIVTFTDAGEDQHHDLEYESTSSCSCRECFHDGTVKDFTFEGLDELIQAKLDKEVADGKETTS